MGQNIRENQALAPGAAASFEDLHIYQRARELTNGIYQITREGKFARDLALTNQIRRASVSIMSNIAEGFERGSKAEFIQFLYIAKGSSGEVRAQLQIAHDQRYIPAKEFERLYDLVRSIGGMISNFIGYLRRTQYRGSKFGASQVATTSKGAAAQAADSNKPVDRSSKPT